MSENSGSTPSNRFANVKLGVNEARMIRHHITTVQETVAEFEEAFIDAGVEPTLEGFKMYLRDKLSALSESKS